METSNKWQEKCQNDHLNVTLKQNYFILCKPSALNSLNY